MNKKVKRLLATIVAAVTASTTLAFSSLSASAINTISNPINYIGYVNFKSDDYTLGYGLANYVRAAESYDTREITYDGTVSGPWASSTPATTDVLDSGSLWSTTLTFAAFNQNIYFPNIYRLKFTRTSTVYGINTSLQDPLIVLAKVNSDTISPSEFDNYFDCGIIALGDADNNGYLSQADLNAIENYYTYGTGLGSTRSKVAADVDFNGVINSADYALLYNLLNGTISSLW